MRAGKTAGGVGWGGGGVGGESEVSLLFISLSLLFFSSLSDFAPYSVI